MASSRRNVQEEEDHIVVCIDCAETNEYKYLNGNFRQVPVSALLCEFGPQNVILNE